MSKMTNNGNAGDTSVLACSNLHELVNCGTFYSLLETFHLQDDCVAHEAFLQRYLNDEGYVDIWRIPHLMLDTVQQKLGNHKLHDDKTFRILFHEFLAALYAWCLSQNTPGGEAPSASDRTGQHDTGALSAIFSEVMACLDTTTASEVKA